MYINLKYTNCKKRYLHEKKKIYQRDIHEDIKVTEHINVDRNRKYNRTNEQHIMQ